MYQVLAQITSSITATTSSLFTCLFQKRLYLAKANKCPCQAPTHMQLDNLQNLSALVETAV